MKRLVDSALVLRRTNYGEADRVVTLLCQEYGIQDVFAKGARSQKSRLAAGVELLTISEVSFIDGKSGLKTLTGARLTHHFADVAKDYERVQLVFEVLQAVSKLTDNDSGQEYFETIKVFYESLEDQTLSTSIISVWIRLRLLNIAGSLPEFVVDVNDAEIFNFDYDTQRFTAHSQGQFGVNDIKLLRLLSSKVRPIRLSTELKSEANLAQFSRLLLKNHLS